MMTNLGTVMELAEAKYRAQVMKSTWGHLDPEPNVTYKGFVILARSAYPGIHGDTTVVDAEFEGLTGSPGLAYALNDFEELFMEELQKGQVGKWVGTMTLDDQNTPTFDGVFKVVRISVPKIHGGYED